MWISLTSMHSPSPEALPTMENTMGDPPLRQGAWDLIPWTSQSLAAGQALGHTGGDTHPSPVGRGQFSAKGAGVNSQHPPLTPVGSEDTR